MTHEERALKLARLIIDNPSMVMGGCSINRFVEEVAAAITAAVDEERLACGHIAKSFECDSRLEEYVKDRIASDIWNRAHSKGNGNE